MSLYFVTDLLFYLIIYFSLLFQVRVCHYQAPHAHQAAYAPQQTHHSHNFGQPAQGQSILHDKNRVQDKEHIKEHLGGIIKEPDLNKMTDEELQFHYFKMHDSDNNNMLDGSELIKSLIHWHGTSFFL